MAYFLAYLIPAMLGIFVIIPFLRMRTNLLDDLEKDDTYFVGLLISIFWPVSLPGWAIVFGSVKMVHLMENFL